MDNRRKRIKKDPFSDENTLVRMEPKFNRSGLAPKSETQQFLSQFVAFAETRIHIPLYGRHGISRLTTEISFNHSETTKTRHEANELLVIMLPLKGVKITLTEMKAPNIPNEFIRYLLELIVKLFFSDTFLFKTHLTFSDRPIY